MPDTRDSNLIEIQPMGDLLPLDKNGFIKSVSSKDKITEPWAMVVEVTKKACIKHFGDNVHSIYIRGSVARGKAIEGVSDVDAFVVLRDEERDFEDSWVEVFQTETKIEFPFCQKIELELIPYQGAMDLNDPEYLADRLMIKTQSACIFGKDLAPKLPGFKPDKTIAFNARAIDKLLGIAKQKLAETEDLEVISAVGTWIMKRLLRTGFELVMEEERAYTRDLYPCYRIFSKYYPQQEVTMRRVLELALNPVSDKSIVLDMVNNFGTWMSNQADTKFVK